MPDELVDARRPPSLAADGIRTAREETHVLRACPGFGEERLEEQVQQQVVATNVDDVGHRGTDARDVAEILIGSDADVRAALAVSGRKGRRDLEIGPLVRHEVVGVEGARRFRQPRDVACKRGRRRRLHAARADGGEREPAGHQERAPVGGAHDASMENATGRIKRESGGSTPIANGERAPG